MAQSPGTKENTTNTESFDKQVSQPSSVPTNVSKAPGALTTDKETSSTTNEVSPQSTKSSKNRGDSFNNVQPKKCKSPENLPERERGQMDSKKENRNNESPSSNTEEIHTKSKAVTPSSENQFVSKGPGPGQTSGTFVISSVSESSMDCAGTTTNNKAMPMPSEVPPLEQKKSSSEGKETPSRVGSRHFTFTESGLKNQNPSDAPTRRLSSRQGGEIVGGTTIMLTNPHGSAGQKYGDMDQYSQPWRPRSRSPVTTSRRGGRGSPVFFRGKSGGSAPNSRSSTPLHFTSAPAAKRHAPSSPERKPNSITSHANDDSNAANFERHHQRVRQDRETMFEKPSAAAAAAAAAAAEATNYLTDQRYRHPVPASVTPAQRALTARPQGMTSERGRIRQSRNGSYEPQYGHEYHEYYRSHAYNTSRVHRQTPQDDHRIPMKDYQRIQTFSQSGSSSEQSQENSAGMAMGKQDPRSKHPHIDSYDKQRYVEMDRRYGRGNPGETTTSRLSPNFTIYHRASVRRPDDSDDPNATKRGTMVIGGSTPIRITHQDAAGRPREYEQSHHRGSGRTPSGSVSSVFRTNSSKDYSHPRGRMSSRERDRGVSKSEYQQRHDYAAQQRSDSNHVARQQAWADQQRRREQYERNERNAPSPSTNEMLKSEHQYSRSSTDRGYRRPPFERVRNSPSLADLPEDSPQRILLSMRTPSVGAGHSFDRSKSSPEEEPKVIKGRSDIQSPPQITKRNNTSGFADNFFSDSSATDGGGLDLPSKSPMRRDRSFVSSVPSNLHYTNSSGERIEIAPSFSLFNPDSFDSLGDCPQVQKSRGGGDVSLSALGSIAHVSSSQPGGGGIGDVQDMSGNPSFGALGNMSIGLGTHTMNLSRSGSMGLMFSLSGANPSFMERSPQRVQSTIRRDDSVLQKSSSSSHPHYSRDKSLLDHHADRSKSHQLTLRENRSLRTRHSSIGSSSPSAQRNNSYGSSNSYSTSSSGPHVYYANICLAPNEASIPGFYHSLIHMRQAFENLTFLLPGLKVALERERSRSFKIEIVYDPDTVGKVLPDGTRCPKDVPKVMPLNKEELVSARRRVVSAICAFGGTNVKKANDVSPSSREEEDKDEDLGQGSNKKQRPSYEDVLASRYYENPDENRLSWDFEEIPPVISAKEEGLLRKQMEERQGGVDGNSSSGTGAGKDGSKSQLLSSPKKESPSKTGQPKMRYRCKLCGQPKQNHVCPYQSSLQRSIGTTIYPALNAFTADEPGDLAPPLIDMNNFVSVDGSPGRPDTEWNSNSPVPGFDRFSDALPVPSLYHGEMDPSSYNHPLLKSSVLSPLERHAPAVSATIRKPSSSELSSLRSLPRKRHVGQVSKSSSKEEMLFVESMELKHEQFRDLKMSSHRPYEERNLTAQATSEDSNSYCYPLLPLPYSQRKGLSDTLFSLSKEVQHLTDECASVLKEARERDMWDLAVAELMTQVMAVLHCPLGDNTLEGLRRHLLKLGIAC